MDLDSYHVNYVVVSSLDEHRIVPMTKALPTRGCLCHEGRSGHCLSVRYLWCPARMGALSVSVWERLHLDEHGCLDNRALARAHADSSWEPAPLLPPSLLPSLCPKGATVFRVSAAAAASPRHPCRPAAAIANGQAAAAAAPAGCAGRWRRRRRRTRHGRPPAAPPPPPRGGGVCPRATLPQRRRRWRGRPRLVGGSAHAGGASALAVATAAGEGRRGRGDGGGGG